MMKTISMIAVAAMLMMLSGCRTANPVKEDPLAFHGQPPEDSSLEQFREWREKTRPERTEWWENDRFGMFIHWGIYAVPAGTYNGERIPGIGEWIMKRAKIPVREYKAYAKDFNPVKYDPDRWVRLAKAAGMKYIVITAKHHDGFALFDSAVSDWDIVDATPYGKDLLEPLAEACRKHGIKLCFYYSQAQDWIHPGGAAAYGGHWDEAQEGDMDEYIKEIAVPQVREILTKYGDLGILWWDTPTDMNPERAAMLYPLLKLQPHIITNNRLGGGFGGDYGTPEQRIPGDKQQKNWETCMTMNRTWGYKSYDDQWKSTQTLIRNLVDIVNKGGNYLLNVGPTPEGVIPQPSIERLEEIGEWMDVNSESIYGCDANPLGFKPEWGRITVKPGHLYLHIFERPSEGRIELPALESSVTRAYLLADPAAELAVETSNDALIIELPEELPDEIDTVIALEVDGEIVVESSVAADAG